MKSLNENKSSLKNVNTNLIFVYFEIFSEVLIFSCFVDLGLEFVVRRLR